MQTSRSILSLLVILLGVAVAPAQTFIALSPVADSDTRVLSVDASPFTVADIGLTGLPALSGLDLQPGTGRLYASGGNTDGGNLYRFITNTTFAVPVGPTGFPSVPGLAFDASGSLFGSAHVSGPGMNANGLIAIDSSTGAGTLVGAFGIAGGNEISGVNALAVHPATDVLYAVTNTAFNGTNGGIFTVDKGTGAATQIGQIVDATSGADVPATIAGLAFDTAGNLYGSLGGGDGRIIAIDLGALTFTAVGVAASGSVSDLALAPSTVLLALNPVLDADTNLLSTSVDPFGTANLGATGLPSLSGLDFLPALGTLYASGGNTDGGNLYTVDPATATATLVGATGFASVPGLAFDFDARLFGTARVSGTGLTANGLVTLNLFTGAGTVVGAFGTIGGFEVTGMDALAIDPFDGTLYGSAGTAFDGMTGSFFTIDKATGQATLLGSLTEASTGALPPAAVAGLSFDDQGRLFGSLGGGDGRIIAIDLGPLTFTFVGDAAEGSVSDIAHFHLPTIDLGFGKPGSNGMAPRLHAVGGLGSGGSAVFSLGGGPVGQIAFLLAGFVFAPTPVPAGGIVVPVPPTFVFGPITLDGTGSFVNTAPGGMGPISVFAQWVVIDPAAPGFFSLSNAAFIVFMP